MSRKKSIDTKKPYEAAQSQIEAYDKSIGKPIANTVFTRNRATEMSRKGDTIKDFSVGLQDLDSAIIYYFENTIKPSVFQDGDFHKVPIIYGSPERWKSIQADGFLRDTNNKVKLPLIIFRRTTVEKNRTLGNKLDGNHASLFQSFESNYNSKNTYDKFSLLTNKIPSKKYYMTVVPDYVTINYECILLTNFVEQNNKIIEAIEFASDSYWGDPKRFQFRAKIDSFAVTTAIEADNDRAARTTFSITLNGYIIPDSINKKLANSTVGYSTSQVIFGLETTTGDAEEVVAIGLRPNIGGGTSFVEGSNNFTLRSVAASDLAYLQVNNTRIADIVTTTTATFLSKYIIQPPLDSTIPATSLGNFSFFANGMLIPLTCVTSFTQVGDNIVLVVDTTLLGYTLVSTDEITAVGKIS